MIAGIDFSSKAVDIVLLDDVSDEATWHRFPIVDKRGAFYAARNVPEATFTRGWWLHSTVWLVGLEDSTYRSAQTVRALMRVQGAILAIIPAKVCVVPLTAQDWKREALGKASASKEEVAAWALAQWPDVRAGVPQDAFDAYALARAVRALNQRGIDAAQATNPPLVA